MRSLLSGREVDEGEVARIALETSFKQQKSGELFEFQDGLRESILRKGVVGDWENHFTDLGEAERMKKLAEDVYKKFGIL